MRMTTGVFVSAVRGAGWWGVGAKKSVLVCESQLCMRLRSSLFELSWHRQYTASLRPKRAWGALTHEGATAPLMILHMLAIYVEQTSLGIRPHTTDSS